MASALRDWSLITGRGGGYKPGGGGGSDPPPPYKKMGGVKPCLRGGTESFGVVFSSLKFYLRGGAKSFGPAIFPFCTPPPRN